MKKIVYFVPIIALAFILISWGNTGHHVIGQIAENHLSPKAREAIQALLGGQSLADVSSWADEVRGNDPEYQSTAPWHFINVELGLSFPDFAKEGDNVYTALLKQEAILKDSHATTEQKVIALKFVVHFVGDIHQPMHISRAEDKGGNTIQVQYDGKGTNLHSLWDTKMLEHGGLNYQQLAEKYDHPAEAQIKKWQGDAPIVWAWESYQISTQLYGEIAAMKGRNIDNAYYEAHLPIVENRIEKAGIRLAGVLNELFKDYKPGAYTGSAAVQQVSTQVKMDPAITINVEDARKHIGETVKICSKVYGHKDFESIALVNMGAAYPDQLLTLMLKNELKNEADQLDNRMICVTGKLILYKDKPEIIVSDTTQISK
jgi:hypothetical protein